MNRIALAIATGIGALTLASACHATPSTPLIPTVPAPSSPSASATPCTLVGPYTFECEGHTTYADYDNHGWYVDGVRAPEYCATEDSCAIAYKGGHAVVIHVIP